jgi:hypothetical protein
MEHSAAAAASATATAAAAAAAAAAASATATAAAGTAVELEGQLDRAAAAIAEADALIVFTGAGMGVDSGLGTYRGANAGVWQAGHDLGLDYDQLCRSQLLHDHSREQPTAAAVAATRIDARLAWAFWRFQHELYTSGSTPHDG